MSEKTMANVTTTYPYKLIAIQECDEIGQYVVVFEVLNQSRITQLPPEKLIKDDQLVLGFSPLDIRTVVQHLCKMAKENEPQIVGYDLAPKAADTVFHVAEQRGQYVIKKSLVELIQDKTTLHRFSAEDAYRIGYFHGLFSTTIPD